MVKCRKAHARGYSRKGVLMDRQPRIPKGGTAGTGDTTAMIGRGVRWREKQCVSCGKHFRTPEDAHEKTDIPLKENGKEVPCQWFASTRQTRINGVSDYRTNALMTQMQAAAYFDKLLGNTVQVARMYRKIRVRKELDLCRTCHKKTLPAKRKAWQEEEIKITRKDGTRVSIMPNRRKPVPQELQGSSYMPKQRQAKNASTGKGIEQIWYCSTPSTRHEVSYTVKTPRPMNLTDAKAWFRFHLSRETLAGCSITG